MKQFFENWDLGRKKHEDSHPWMYAVCTNFMYTVQSRNFSEVLFEQIYYWCPLLLVKWKFSNVLFEWIGTIEVFSENKIGKIILLYNINISLIKDNLPIWVYMYHCWLIYPRDYTLYYYRVYHQYPSMQVFLSQSHFISHHMNTTKGCRNFWKKLSGCFQKVHHSTINI